MFDGTRDLESRGRKSNIKIHEDASGSIYTTGVTSRLVHSEEEVGNVFRECLCDSAAPKFRMKTEKSGITYKSILYLSMHFHSAFKLRENI